MPEPPKPLVVLFGPTASGKTALSLALALRFGAEILSCDSVAVYRHMQVGTAKPTAGERLMVPHHCLDLYEPSESCTAGDWARAARAVLAGLAERGTLPLIAGGTGLYGRALLDGLHPAPPADPHLRELLRRRLATRDAGSLHRTLSRLDPAAARAIHRNDVPKLIRAIEVTVAGRKPLSRRWDEPTRDALTGYRVLRLGLAPPREVLYPRIDERAARMFAAGLVEETRDLLVRFGPCRPLGSLGYAEACAVLRGEMGQAEAVRRAQQGHRQYSKRQGTWFRREGELHEVVWLRGVGDDPAVQQQAVERVSTFLSHSARPGPSEPAGPGGQ